MLQANVCDNDYKSAVLSDNQRKDKKTAARIIEDNPKIKENIRIEENIRNQYYPLNKQRKRGYER